MLRWYKNLYLGNTVRGQEKKLMRRLEKGKPAPGVWLVTIASNEQNNLDVIPSSAPKGFSGALPDDRRDRFYQSGSAGDLASDRTGGLSGNGKYEYQSLASGERAGGRPER